MGRKGNNMKDKRKGRTLFTLGLVHKLAREPRTVTRASSKGLLRISCTNCDSCVCVRLQ